MAAWTIFNFCRLRNTPYFYDFRELLFEMDQANLGGSQCNGKITLLLADKPLSYTQVRRMCNRIKRDTGFDENITPIRFRSTVLTDIYDQTKDIKLAQYAAGHTTSAMTLKYYVKGRETYAGAATAAEHAYNVGQKLVN